MVPPPLQGLLAPHDAGEGQGEGKAVQVGTKKWKSRTQTASAREKGALLCPSAPPLLRSSA